MDKLTVRRALNSPPYLSSSIRILIIWLLYRIRGRYLYREISSSEVKDITRIERFLKQRRTQREFASLRNCVAEFTIEGILATATSEITSITLGRFRTIMETGEAYFKGEKVSDGTGRQTGRVTQLDFRATHEQLDSLIKPIAKNKGDFHMLMGILLLYRSPRAKAEEFFPYISKGANSEFERLNILRATILQNIIAAYRKRVGAAHLESERHWCDLLDKHLLEAREV